MKKLLKLTSVFTLVSLSLSNAFSRNISEINKKPVVVKFTDQEGKTEKIIIERKPKTLPPRKVTTPTLDIGDEAAIELRRIDEEAGLPPNEAANPVHDAIHDEPF